MEENLESTFHENNKNILFTIATLSGNYELDERAEDKEYTYHIGRENIIYTQEYIEKAEEEQRLEQEEKTVHNGNKQAILLQPKPDEALPESDISKSVPRDSDLLGLNDFTRSQQKASKEEDTYSDNQPHDFYDNRKVKANSSINQIEDVHHDDNVYRKDSEDYDEEDDDDSRSR
uniref:Uncharacterized protein n=1 Tax=Euplotes harpa TaxID=151035 RepID=A0A7S3JMM3_9SPIT|mmetsp:Transcript_5073/g.5995  ORF Transcript_5073/g.5995 Transcript_5073/m.5995 type:complete len:175 (+) Transcript_5073:430-954(+)|eukprot:CAMPEP_0168351558 /NCGR_PEP_ID=MMETSP0213-20121227/21946_1 /TAXON_ID=151035 /ORGANISM="Euplotes harpa, Strain FSP1.4" /LENGTH=174 /DNA_ID=CAMNT_0008362439 /DNA_START=419 /DNA_END=943 /DNA_ORIENTATION=+